MRLRREALAHRVARLSQQHMKIAWFTIPLLAGLLIGSLPFVIARLMS
jgi:hypothetical protein